MLKCNPRVSNGMGRKTYQTRHPPECFSDLSKRASGVLSLGFLSRKQSNNT